VGQCSGMSPERLWSLEVGARVSAEVDPGEPDEPGAFAAANLGVEGVLATAGLSLGVCPGDHSMHVFGVEEVVLAGVGLADPEDDAVVDGGIAFPLGVQSRIDGFDAHRVSIAWLGVAALGQCSGMSLENLGPVSYDATATTARCVTVRPARRVSRQHPGRGTLRIEGPTSRTCEKWDG